MQRRGQDWYCGVCGPRRERCAACGQRPAGAPSATGTGSRDAASARPMTGGIPWPSSPGRYHDRPGGARRGGDQPRCRQSPPGPGSATGWPGPLQDRPGLLTGAGAQAPVPSVLRLIDRLCDAGATGIVRPACPRCGRVIHLHRRIDGQWCCRNCVARSRAQPCARCGAVRQAAARDEHGRPLCPNCLVTDPANQETCAGCGRRRPVSVRSPDGPLCATCAPGKDHDLRDLRARRPRARSPRRPASRGAGPASNAGPAAPAAAQIRAGPRRHPGRAALRGLHPP